MANFIFSHNSLSKLRPPDSFRSFLFFIPIILALTTSLFIFFYISSTSKLLIFQNKTHVYIRTFEASIVSTPAAANISFSGSFIPAAGVGESETLSFIEDDSTEGVNSQRPSTKLLDQMGSINSNYGNEDNEVFHDKEIFLEDYKEMNRSLKIYVYPHKPNDPFANVLLPVHYVPSGNYASESYFKKLLMKSHFITNDPSEADLFYLPFSIASMRHDKRIGVGGIQGFIRDYIYDVSHQYPYWNRSGGADHFYVACHSIGKVAMEKAPEVKNNAIQLVCTSNYFVQGYVPHKDASLPQIWPRQGEPPNVPPSKRKRLAFFAGAMNSPVRQKVLQSWKNDKEIFVNNGRLRTPYSTELLNSKFCLHVKGYEVNTARIGDAMYYGCVPVILADHYDLPFEDILDWKSFSVVVTHFDIPLLKKVLKGISVDEYLRLQSNVLKVQRHFQWHVDAADYDAFYMVMYELWVRRSSVRIEF